MDVTLTGDHPCDLDFQRRAYADLFGVCLAVPACRGITTWGITDRFTWVDDFFRVTGRPLLFNEEYQPKPAYFAARDALLARACPSGATCDLACTAASCEAADVCPVDPPFHCCATDTDCAGNACRKERSCDAHVCTDAVPVECDDGDPCSVATCDLDAGCILAPVTGFDFPSSALSPTILRYRPPAEQPFVIVRNPTPTASRASRPNRGACRFASIARCLPRDMGGVTALNAVAVERRWSAPR